MNDDLNLPTGWEHFKGKNQVLHKVLKKENTLILDEQGIYYWHKLTGTVTRNRPESIMTPASLTLLSSPSTDMCFEINSLMYKSVSDISIQVILVIHI